MMPGHNADPLTDKSPFLLNVNPLNSNEFEGIMK